MDHPLVSILTVHYRTEKFKPEYYRTLKENTPSVYELLEYDAEKLPNKGFAANNNHLIRKARGEFIVLLNPDTKVGKGWLDSLLARAKSNPRIGIVGPIILSYDGSTIDTAGHFYDENFWVWDRGHREPYRSQYSVPQRMPSVTMCCALLKREMINMIGLFDERVLMYFEDVEYGWRANRYGWEVWYEPASIVYHYHGGGGPHSELERKAFFYYMQILREYYPGKIWKKAWNLLPGILAGVKNLDFDYTMKRLEALRILLGLRIPKERFNMDA